VLIEEIRQAYKGQVVAGHDLDVFWMAIGCTEPLWGMSGWGLVSRASPVHTAVRNCPGDEGGPFGFGDQVADPKPPQAAVVKSDGGERCGKVGATIPAGKVERGERKRIVDEVSKAD